jgi:F0F1-type ATP synthase membrane subunit a
LSRASFPRIWNASRWQNLLEIVVTGIEKQIEDVGLRHPEKYIGFLGTLFLFIALASLCTIIPGYEPPTGSLSTTAALALCVLVAVPFFGIEEQGLGGYLKSYRADDHHAAVQHHQRTFAHAGPGGPPVRQHDERDDDLASC